MGLFLKKEISKTSILGIWEITETNDNLLCQLQLTTNEQEKYNSIISDLRKSHWLCTRVLLNVLLREAIKINYDKNGKPYLSSRQLAVGNLQLVTRNSQPTPHISISHSGKFVAILVSEHKEIGIDIEKISDKILKIAHKFMHEKELKFLSANTKTEQLHIIWGAKEALYKLYGKKKLIFKEDMLIEPFEYAGKGMIQGHLKNKRYQLVYEKIEDYMLVYNVYNIFAKKL